LKADTLDPHSSHLGLVVAGYGRHCVVEAPSGERLLCHPRGKKAHFVVGDRVRWMVSGDEGVIEEIEPRRNLLFREDAWKTKAFAANLDQVILVVSSDPVFSESQLARALIAAESAGIAARILLNKVDLPKASHAMDRLKPYPAMGYPVLPVSLKADPMAATQTLLPWLEGRASLVLGPSGAGKSTLINLLAPNARAQVGEVSLALRSGRHTTTATHWYWLDAERRTALIDSPGFQAFGLRQIAAQNLTNLMPDLRDGSTHCRFYNCTHRKEPGCGVRAALEAGDITESRYRIYGEIREELGAGRP
jgi:ribosome biogenesis GTPase